MRRAPVFAPVFTALRRGELLRRGKECGMGSATVPVAVFGVAPKTLQPTNLSNDGSGASHAPRCPSGIRAPFRAPSKIAQPFMAGTRGPQISKVPSGTKEPFCRPSRDFSIWLTPDPAINGWAIVVVSLHDCQTPIAPIVHTKMKTGKEPFQCGMRNAECGMRPSSLPSSMRYDAASCFDAARSAESAPI
jgi:hypothetical protein